MKKMTIVSLIVLPLFAGIAGCVSSSSPSPPSHTTVVVPPSDSPTVVCGDGTAPPC